MSCYNLSTVLRQNENKLKIVQSERTAGLPLGSSRISKSAIGHKFYVIRNNHTFKALYYNI